MQIDTASILPVVSFGFTIIATVYAYTSQRDKATTGEIRTLISRVQKLEADIAHVPDKDSFHRIEMGVQKVQGEVESMKEQWTTALRSIQRLEEFLLNAPPVAIDAARRRTAKK